MTRPKARFKPTSAKKFGVDVFILFGFELKGSLMVVVLHLKINLCFGCWIIQVNPDVGFRIGLNDFEPIPSVTRKNCQMSIKFAQK